MTTTKTNADRIRELPRALELLQEHDATRSVVAEALQINDDRDGYIANIYDLGPSDDDRYGTGPHSYVAEIEGGPHGLEHGTTYYRIVVAGGEEEPGVLREPEPRAYLTLDHAILALVAHRNGNEGDSYAVATSAARALGVDTGIE